MRISPSSTPPEEVELVSGLAPFLGGGKAGWRFARLVELLQCLLLTLRSSTHQKVVGVFPLAPDGSRLSQSWHLSPEEKFSAQGDVLALSSECLTADLLLRENQNYLSIMVGNVELSENEDPGAPWVGGGNGEGELRGNCLMGGLLMERRG